MTTFGTIWCGAEEEKIFIQKIFKQHNDVFIKHPPLCRQHFIKFIRQRCLKNFKGQFRGVAQFVL